MRSVQTLLVHIMSVSTDHRQSNMVFNTDRGKSRSDIVIYDRVRTVCSIPFTIFIKMILLQSNKQLQLHRTYPPQLVFVD